MLVADILDMNADRRKQIGEFADSVRLALALPTPTSIPDIEKAVRALNGRIVDANPLGHEASIRRLEGDRFEISLDRTKAATRQLFSLGHELGHLFIHMGFGNPEVWNQQRDYVESYARSGYDEEEFVAHEFAAALLMPCPKFTELVGRMDIVTLAAYFGVSQEAALMRGRWLGLLPWS